ncbi:MAG TPA: hypothetical protein VN790_02565 [Steroidobacteraceae bacterium]|nr:hypothetical protein [Steroidobacteraceae bacterium]
MTTFIILAAIMAAVALGLVVWPLYRARASDGKGGLVAIGVVVILLPVAAALLYHTASNWNWDPKAMEAAAGGQHSLQQMVTQLEARLQSEPDDVQGWLMLGRSRFVMNNYAGAASAFGEAYRASKGQNFEAVIGYGEALAVSDETTMRGKAAQLFEDALKMDASNPKALWYGGLAAATAGRLDVARERWMTLVKQPLPDEVRALVAQRIGELDQQLGRKPDPELAMLAKAAPAPAAEATATASASASASATAAVANPGSVTVHVKVSPALAGKVPSGTPLFVLARDPTQPGPPFAAKRFPDAALPMDVVLTEQDAMMPTRTLKNAQQLVIVARYSTSGMPTAASGDLYGEVPYDLAAGRPVDLLIDKQVP